MYMASHLLMGFLCSVLVLTSAAHGDHDDLYRDQLRTINRDFDREEDALRYHYKAAREYEEQAWKQARRHVSGAQRRYLDQQYKARRKTMAREYVDQRKDLNRQEDYTRDAVRDGYRGVTHLNYRPQPLFPAPVPNPSPYREEIPPPQPVPTPFDGPIYDDRDPQ